MGQTMERWLSPAPVTVQVDLSLADRGEVVLAMAAHKYGCAVVVERGTVVGIFTSVDALRLLGLMLTERYGARRRHRAPLGPTRRKPRPMRS